MSTKAPLIYLDHAASTPPCRELLAAWPAVAADAWYNPGAGYTPAGDLRRRLAADERALLEKLQIPVAGTRIIWTGGATEAANLAIRGFRESLENDPVFAAPATEHACVDAALTAAAPGWRRLPVTADGSLDWPGVEVVLDRPIRLVCLAAVQNETGVIHDLIRLRALLDRLSPRARLLVDGVQALGRTVIPWQAARIDMLFFSGHKIHGPGGVGCLIVREGTPLRPILVGGGQQDNLRSGTLDGAGVLGFCLAATAAIDLQQTAREQVGRLASRLWAGLTALHDAGHLPAWQRLSPPDGSPFICSFAFPGYQGAILVRMLSEHGVCVGSGSACAAETSTPSRVLTAQGIPADTAFGALRVSFARTSTPAEVDAFLDALATVIREW